MAADAMEEIFFRYMRRSHRGRGIGFSSNLRVRCFLDLLSAAHDPVALTEMVAQLSGLVRRHAASNVAVLAPKWGNVLLARALAEDLGVPSGFFKSDPLFGHWLEGQIERQRNWLLVDDVASDGERLEELILRVRERGIRIEHAFFIVERTEGDVEESLARVGVATHVVVQANDAVLEELHMRLRPVSRASAKDETDRGEAALLPQALLDRTSKRTASS